MTIDKTSLPTGSVFPLPQFTPSFTHVSLKKASCPVIHICDCLTTESRTKVKFSENDIKRFTALSGEDFSHHHSNCIERVLNASFQNRISNFSTWFVGRILDDILDEIELETIQL